MSNETFYNDEENDKTVTSEYRVDEYDAVYDEERLFFCNYIVLTDAEKELVKQNPMSFRYNK